MGQFSRVHQHLFPIPRTIIHTTCISVALSSFFPSWVHKSNRLDFSLQLSVGGWQIMHSTKMVPLRPHRNSTVYQRLALIIQPSLVRPTGASSKRRPPYPSQGQPVGGSHKPADPRKHSHTYKHKKVRSKWPIHTYKHRYVRMHGHKQPWRSALRWYDVAIVTKA